MKNGTPEIDLTQTFMVKLTFKIKRERMNYSLFFSRVIGYLCGKNILNSAINLTQTQWDIMRCRDNSPPKGVLMMSCGMGMY